MSGSDLGLDQTGFEVVSAFEPSGDQPAAIDEIVARFERGERHVVLHGATGTGKSATTAWVVERLQRPTLVLAPNKVLAAQLAAELRELLPNNKVCFFVSHFAYYRPEAYIASTDTYVEKDSAIDDEIERLRHEATLSLLTRPDVVVVASVSAIYGLGRPEEYRRRLTRIRLGDRLERDDLIRALVGVEYHRNDVALERGTVRVRGDVVDVVPASGEQAYRVEFFGDEVERLAVLDPLTGELLDSPTEVFIPPASHHVFDPALKEAVLADIRAELAERLGVLEGQGKLLEAQRLRQRTEADLESLETTGFCKGIENYARHFDRRKAGDAPSTLLSYFPDGFLTVIDESHVTVPQLGAMFEGDQSRKQTLVQYGFRLPSALDNRPLRSSEFFARLGPVLYLSATPGPWEHGKAVGFVEQVIRPTGLVDPELLVVGSEGRLEDLTSRIAERVGRGERALVTTLTKRQAEQLCDWLTEQGFRVQYLHHDVDTVSRISILRQLRLGTVDVVVGVNLLREGLDLPEVSLVAVLDADTEGFLRSATSLIQTIGRAARNPNGQVVLYADRVTPAMRDAISETDRRRAKQLAFNAEHGVTPRALVKPVRDVIDDVRAGAASQPRARRLGPAAGSVDDPAVLRAELDAQLQSALEAMRMASKALRFEEAAAWRDEAGSIRALLAELDTIAVPGAGASPDMASGDATGAANAPGS